MPKIASIVKSVAAGVGALAAASVVATRIIDARQERKYCEVDALPCDPENPLPGQRPYPGEFFGHEMGFYERHVKRPQDFACALIAIIGLAPIMAGTAILVRMKLGSPVIFKQKRPGKDGRVFDIYKFRTMTDQRDGNGELLSDEDRLSAFGQKLRSLSLDELPELFNILKGDMAIIGPRPLLVQYLPLYNDHQARRHSIRPGLSGRSQVIARNLMSWEDRFDNDVAYVDDITFAGDWKLIGKTVLKVIKREGISSSTSITMEGFQGNLQASENQPVESRKNLLFMSLGPITTLNANGIYTDLLRVFVTKGWNVSVLSPIDRLDASTPEIIKENECTIVRVETGKIQKTNLIEKGVNTLLIEPRFICAIKKYFYNKKFDLILYPTPPITLVGAVKYVKMRDNARTYLMLKDIFPQNSVDIGLLTTTGIRGVLYGYFRNKEKKLYALSDTIGCLSLANIDYLAMHDPEISIEKLEVCPNSIEPIDMSVSQEERIIIRSKYGIPQDKTVFVYGGNLGKPQGIPFIISCLKSQESNDRVFFLIVGDGTEYGALEEYIVSQKPRNVKLMSWLSQEDYCSVVGSCDIGLIFLDHRFLIPNFPSRLLSYMQVGIPVLAATDKSTDIGKVIVENEFGWWCESNSTSAFGDCVEEALRSDLKEMGKKGWEYLLDNYTAERNYRLITSHEDEGKGE